jgi:putative ABC transport system permease protein
VRQAVRSIDPNLPVTDIAAMPDVLASSVAQPRFRTWLLGLFGIVALLLAAAGIFGVISYSVAQRAHEIGVRAALGAGRGDQLRLILGKGVALSALGLVIGVVGSLGLTQLLASLLFGVSAHDPWTLGTVFILLAMVAGIACFIPAWRATKIDPMAALRCE